MKKERENKEKGSTLLDSTYGPGVRECIQKDRGRQLGSQPPR